MRIGLSKFASVKVATAVSELARNIVFYAGKGTVELRSLKDDRGVVGLQIIASDQGPGHPAGQARGDLGRHLQIAARHGQGSGRGQEAGGRVPARHPSGRRHHRDLHVPGGTLKTGGFSRPYKGLYHLWRQLRDRGAGRGPPSPPWSTAWAMATSRRWRPSAPRRSSASSPTCPWTRSCGAATRSCAPRAAPPSACSRSTRAARASSAASATSRCRRSTAQAPSVFCLAGIVGHNMRSSKVMSVTMKPGDIYCLMSDGVSTRGNLKSCLPGPPEDGGAAHRRALGAGPRRRHRPRRRLRRSGSALRPAGRPFRAGPVSGDPSAFLLTWRVLNGDRAQEQDDRRT